MKDFQGKTTIKMIFPFKIRQEVSGYGQLPKEVRTRLNLQIAPLFWNRYTAHQYRPIFCHKQIITGIYPYAVLLIIQTGFYAESHVLPDPGIVPQRNKRRLVAFKILTWPMCRPVIDEILHAVFHLMQMDFISHIGAAHTGFGLFHLNLNTVSDYLPHLVLLR